jgi:drug/metabolite transporter (DMT)-like permease
MKFMYARHDRGLYGIAGIASAFLFGAATPASKVLLDGIHAQALAGLLYLGAALGVLPVVIGEKDLRWPWRAGRATVGYLAGAVLLGGILGPLLLLLGLKNASAGSVSLWLNLELVATALLGHFLFREHLTPKGWIAAAGITASAVVLAQGNAGGGGILPAVLIAAGCLCWGFDNHFTALIDGISPAQTTWWKGLIAGSFNLIAGGVALRGGAESGVIAVALAVGALSYGVSITLYVYSAQGMGATRSQMIFSAAPFFGLLLSATVLGEKISGSQAIATGMVVVSLFVLFSEKHAHTHRHPWLSHRHRHRHDAHHQDHDNDPSGAKARHSHRHEHQPLQHDHGHWPDLHHRHVHEDDDDSGPTRE